MKSLVLIFLFVLLQNAYAAQDTFHDGVWMNEKLGQYIPADIKLYEESGTAVNLKDLVNKPTIMTIVYYHCGHICPQMLLGLSEVLSKLEFIPGKDYKVVTLSFDEMDTPEDGRIQKRNYMKAINRPLPEDSWKFLTGSKENIEKIAGAVGIKFKRVMHGFIHPEVIIFLSPQGRITRYLHVPKFSYGLGYPVTFSSVDFTTAIDDASKGIIKTGVTGMPLYCFPHEPEQQKRFFHMLEISGVVTLLLMLSLFIYLKITSKKFPGRTK